MQKQGKQYRIVTMYTSQNIDTSFESFEEAREKSRAVRGDFSIWEIDGDEMECKFSTI
jgi:hypothetical protein